MAERENRTDRAQSMRVGDGGIWFDDRFVRDDDLAGCRLEFHGLQRAGQDAFEFRVRLRGGGSIVVGGWCNKARVLAEIEGAPEDDHD